MSSNQKKNIKVVKRRRLNKKKLAFVIIVFILIVSILLGIIFKLFGLLSSKTEKKQVSNVASASENSEQFDLQDEKKSSIAKSYTVFIDPGHGGNDGGSSMPRRSDILEKDINLKIAKKVASFLLKQDDVQVILSRTDDKFISLNDRAEMANKQGADVFVSIHLNSFPNIKEASGVETYYTKDSTYKSEELALSIQETIVSYVPTRDRGIKTDEFTVLTNSKMPAVLIEAGFLSNEEEGKRLLDETYQSELAQGIAQGILTFLDEYLSE